MAMMTAGEGLAQPRVMAREHDNLNINDIFCVNNEIVSLFIQFIGSSEDDLSTRNERSRLALVSKRFASFFNRKTITLIENLEEWYRNISIRKRATPQVRLNRLELLLEYMPRAIFGPSGLGLLVDGSTREVSEEDGSAGYNSFH